METTKDYTLNYWILFYLMGYISAYLQHRKNDRRLNDEPRTNEDLLRGVFMSIFSWGWFVITLVIYWAEERTFSDLKDRFKNWKAKETNW